MLKKYKKIFTDQSDKLIIDSQQQALKLFMNVMYGYTAAGFTGQMPC